MYTSSDWTGLGCMALAACSTNVAPTKSVVRPAAPPAGSVAEFLPLEPDTVLAYDSTDEGTGQRGTIILQVARPRAALVEIRNGGTVTRLELVEDGVRFATGGYWLKSPLSQGNCWTGKAGRTCVTAVDRKITVPAGQYERCLETVEQTQLGNRVTTVFCPGVGMTVLTVEQETGARYEHMQAVLRSYAPKVDIDRLPDSLRGRDSSPEPEPELEPND